MGKEEEVYVFDKNWFKFFPIPAHLPMANLCPGGMERNLFQSWDTGNLGQFGGVRLA